MQEEDQIEETENHHSSKKRKASEKVVVKVKIEATDKSQQKNEGPPSDCWSWRKYGQKPIKGSPYPRGYYRCSTSKGCSAKKQVERSKNDASMLIVTYTSTHNHPGPHFHLSSLPHTPKQQLPHHEDHPPTEIPTPENTPPADDNCDSHIIVTQQESSVEIAKSSFSDQGKLPMEEYDFYDELEELPIPSFFTTNSFCEERAIIYLS